MRCLLVRAAKKAHPFGDERIVNQPWPAALPTDQTDPFLMCDDFAFESEGLGKTDEYPIGWHPHCGIDIMTYGKQGVIRHADSMGNRTEYATPGGQCMNCGSGIYHAEGGGSPAGEVDRGFQIWVNVPAAKKMHNPRYCGVPPERMTTVDLGCGGVAWLLAGDMEGCSKRGPFETSQNVQIIDFEITPGATLSHQVPSNFNTCLVYAYEGAGSVAGAQVKARDAACLDATGDARNVTFIAGKRGLSVMFFAGERINEPIAWKGSIVMNTQKEIQQTYRAIRQRVFPPKRVPWDYTRVKAELA